MKHTFFFIFFSLSLPLSIYTMEPAFCNLIQTTPMRIGYTVATAAESLAGFTLFARGDLVPHDQIFSTYV